MVFSFLLTNSSESSEEVLVSNEYKHLNIYKDSKFVQGALVNSAKLEKRPNQIRYLASLEGHKIIDTGFVNLEEKYMHIIVEDEKIHQIKLRLSDIKTAYRLFIKAGNDDSLSLRDKETVLRLIVIMGNFVKRAGENE